MLDFIIYVILSDFDGEFDLFYFDRFLLFLGLFLLFFLLVAEFAVVHYFANGRFSVRRD